MRKVYRYCERCGRQFHARRRFCSDECRKASVPPWNKGRTGLAANRPRNGTEIPCATCGKMTYRPKCAINRPYCSPDCYQKARWGDSHVETRPCIICGGSFQCEKSLPNTCCSAKCRSERKSQLRRGENSEFWRGGKSAPYHKEWKSVRRRALERDGYKCRLCSSTDRIQVHHKIPYRYCHSHDLDNLISLCRSCHSKEELKVNQATADGLLLRWPQRESSPEKSEHTTLPVQSR